MRQMGFLAANELIFHAGDLLRTLIKTQCMGLLNEVETMRSNTDPWGALRQVITRLRPSPPIGSSVRIGEESLTIEGLAADSIERMMNQDLKPLVYRCKGLCSNDLWNSFEDGCITESEFLLRVVDCLHPPL